MPSKKHDQGTSVPPAHSNNSALATLANIDGYLDALAYAPDHPWRTEIAAALAAQAQEESGTDHLGEALDLACVARSFIVDNIAPVMNAISELADLTGAGPKDNGCRLSLVRKLARLGNQLVDEAATDMEGHQADLQAKLDALGELA